MATIESNLESEIAPAILGLGRLLDLSAPGDGGKGGKGSTRGARALNLVARRIRKRSIQGQRGADGRSWRSGNPERAGRPVGVHSGEMLSEVQLDGVQLVTSDHAVMTYGVSASARAKATAFQEGGGTRRARKQGKSRKRGTLKVRRRPARPFYEMDDSDVTALDRFFTAEGAQSLAEPPGALIRGLASRSTDDRGTAVAALSRQKKGLPLST